MLADERYLWHEGRKVARLSELVSLNAKGYGRQGYSEMKIDGPIPTRNQRDAARGRGIALPVHVYMRVALKKVERDGQPVWLCELINPANLGIYLEWFPKMALERGE